MLRGRHGLDPRSTLHQACLSAGDAQRPRQGFFTEPALRRLEGFRITPYMKFFVVLAMVLLVTMIAMGVKTRGGEEARPGVAPAVVENALPLVPEPVQAPEPSMRPAKKITPRPATSPTVPTPAASASAPATSTPTPATPPAFQAFSIEADDAGFYPATITVRRDTVVSLTFRVRSAGVYGGGLDIRSPYFDTGSVVTGGIKTVSFNTPARPETITFSSFAQGTGNKKAEGTVVVE